VSVIVTDLFCFHFSYSRWLYFDCLFFFFFQAEDGIRDRNVTGVQTCALPISVMSNLGLHLAMRAADITVRTTGVGDRYVLEELRSEERRVGKECRARWSPGQ